jgi:hypothetical protein
MDMTSWSFRNAARIAAAALLCTILGSAAAAAQTVDSQLANGRQHGVIPTQRFPAFGASGDASVEDHCQPGQYIVGLKYRAGDWFDQVQITCAFVGASGGVYALSDGPARGGNGGGAGATTCGNNRVVSGIDLQTTQGNRQVARIVLRCEDTLNHSISSLAVSGPSPKTAGKSPPQYCPGADAAIGLAIRYGKHVNAIGLVCSGLSRQPGR